jgi:hypothetical protein
MGATGQWRLLGYGVDIVLIVVGRGAAQRRSCNEHCGDVPPLGCTSAASKPERLAREQSSFI